MRTTVTLDPDTEAMIRRRMRERGLSFKDAVNNAIRAGLSKPSRRHVPVPTFAMGRPRVDVTKTLQLAAALEDEEIVRKLELRK